MTHTAVFVDGAFFLKRYRKLFPEKGTTATEVAEGLFSICTKHLEPRHSHIPRSNLYRIFYYDCQPSQKKVHHPITGKSIDFSKSDQFKFRTELFRELSKKRKMALRLGRLAEGTAGWQIKSDPSKKLLSKKITVENLTETDVFYNIKQKGVDMRLGLDIASLAYKKLVDQIVVIAGDADFVPAAKLARREGLDVVLDPMWNPIPEDLHLHIDGLRSVCQKPAK